MYIENTYSNKALIPFWVAHLFFLFLLILVLAVEMMELAGDIGYEPPYEVGMQRSLTTLKLT